MVDQKDFQQRMQQIEKTVQSLEMSTDPKARTNAVELMRLLMELHSTSITRMMEIIADKGEIGTAIIDNFAHDNIVSSLLLLYDLHPENIHTRVMQALEKIRPYIHSHASKVNFLGIVNGVVKLNLQSSHNNNKTSNLTLKSTIEDAIYQAAPDINGIEIQDAATLSPALVQLNRKAKKTNSTAVNTLAQETVPVENCNLCSSALAFEHQHLIEPISRKLLCVCNPCAILFDNPQGKYWRIPRRILFLKEFCLTDAEWDSLRIPIGLAFFSYSTVANKVIALYPSPAGSTESLLSLESWAEIVEKNSVLKLMSPNVEALIVNRLSGTRQQNKAEYYIVPIDECYKLVGIIRSRWQGISGGTELWQEIEVFFTKLKERATLTR